ncbi:MAG: glycoside hydrolase family 15 protein [Elusimicrobiota bacterium]|nr:MAG: glycoside hydrolase family 15 protein [Elusimicrobiota bacterium]
MIGNCRTAALVSSHGSIDWCCWPNFDSPSVFAAILDSARGGSFSLTPVGAPRGRQTYASDTNVLETVFETAEGAARLVDCFPVREESAVRGELWPDQEILRIVEGVSGHVDFEAVFAPRPEYGAKAVRFEKRGRFGTACTFGKHLLLLHCEVELRARDAASGPELRGSFRVRAGERVVFSLTYSQEAPAVVGPLASEALRRLEQTKSFWRSWVSQCRHEGPYRDEVRRSALALKLLTFAPSGAIIAAPTTSLPEALGGSRNWDYRYCWLRDASFTTRAFLSLGFQEEAKTFMSWTLHATALTRPRLQLLYSLYGRAIPKEREIAGLSGYRQSRPVRVGNAASRQFQLDIYGETLDGVFQLLPFLERIDSETRRFVIEKARAVCELWEQPDEGIWEVRSGRQHHTHSKALAWVALDRAVRACRRWKWEAPIEEFEAAAARLRSQIEARGFNSRLDAYTRTFDGEEVDASLLVLPLVGYCDASSERMQGTRRAVSQQLSRNGLVYRYRRDRTRDGLPGGDGAFGLCTFWMAENLALCGRVDEAKRWFEAVLSRRNAVQLWSEEIDPETGEFLGNYPQAFTHIGLINAACAISKASEAR